MLDAAQKSMQPPFTPYMAYHHPDNPNKVVVILSPGSIPSEVDGKINFAGHGFQHYVKALCPEKKGANGISQGRDGTMEALREAVQDLLNPSPVARLPTTLAKRLAAKKLDKEELRAMDTCADYHIAAGVEQLLKENEVEGGLASIAIPLSAAENNNVKARRRVCTPDPSATQFS